MTKKLNKKIIISGQIEALSGLAIGGSNTAMGIGGVDKGVIRNPISKEPYIPGSSLKGKMRSLLELRNGTIGDKSMGAVKNGPSDNSEHRSVKLFGSANNSDKQHPSRIIVRDAVLSKMQLKNEVEINKDNFFKDTDLLYTEVKTEVVIDRITSKAMPRQMERVPAGARFDFELILNIFEDEKEIELLSDTFAALKLVQNDYIGGSGSRGSGQVKFHIDRMVERTETYYMLDGKETNKSADLKKYFE
jgi:CRISPR-associated protein Csm3